MPRYYFHVRGRDGLRRDVDGIELADLQAARARAVKRACEIWSAHPPQPGSNDDAFEIADEAGRTVLTVPFSEAFAERAVT
jgi:hypothetical protein